MERAGSMHVLILNQTFHPDVAATGQLMWDLAQHLDQRRHRVSVVTSRNFYGTDRRHEHMHERINAIQIHRLGGTAFGKKHLLGRMLDFASFYFAAAAHLQRHPPPDVILTLTSPPMIATLASMQKRLRRNRTTGRRIGLVYHVMDLYPDAAVESGLLRADGLLDRLLGSVTARTFETSDAIIALGHDMRARIIDRYLHQTSAEKVHVVQPWADGKALSPLQHNQLARELGLGDTFNIVYSGNLGVAHDVETLIAAMQIMRDDSATRWVFIGGGKHFEKLRSRVVDLHWDHIRFLPFQPRERLNESLNVADVHLVSQLPSFTGVVVPSKLFGILAVGKPAVMVGPADAECSRVIVDAEAGFVVPNGDAEMLAKCLRRLRDEPQVRERLGRNGRKAFEQHYDRPVACERITTILEHAVAAVRR